VMPKYRELIGGEAKAAAERLPKIAKRRSARRSAASNAKIDRASGFSAVVMLARQPCSRVMSKPKRNVSKSV
jgi:hypothetical protein